MKKIRFLLWRWRHRKPYPPVIFREEPGETIDGHHRMWSAWLGYDILRLSYKTLKGEF